jgi:hypothetical protein
MALNKKQAAKALYISLRTLERRMKAGTYKFTSTGEGHWAEVSFSCADLGLPEPKEAVSLPYQDVDMPQRAPEQPQKAFPTRKPSPIDVKTASDLEFAERYRAGEATDSYGNDINGSNKLCPTIGAQCGVKSRDVEVSLPPDSQSHMDPALISTNDTLGNPIDPEFKMGTQEYCESRAGLIPTTARTRDGKAMLCPGLSPESYAAMMHQWDKHNGTPSESQMAEKIRNDRAAIRRAFPRGNAIAASRGLAQ